MNTYPNKITETIIIIKFRFNQWGKMKKYIICRFRYNLKRCYSLGMVCIFLPHRLYWFIAVNFKFINFSSNFRRNLTSRIILLFAPNRWNWHQWIKGTNKVGGIIENQLNLMNFNFLRAFKVSFNGNFFTVVLKNTPIKFFLFIFGQSILNKQTLILKPSENFNHSEAFKVHCNTQFSEVSNQKLDCTQFNGHVLSIRMGFIILSISVPPLYSWNHISFSLFLYNTFQSQTKSKQFHVRYNCTSDWYYII